MPVARDSVLSEAFRQEARDRQPSRWAATRPVAWRILWQDLLGGFRLRSIRQRVSGQRALFYTLVGYAFAPDSRADLLVVNTLVIALLFSFFGAYDNYWDWRLLGEENATGAAIQRWGLRRELGLALACAPWLLIVPLILLAIPSIGSGWWIGEVVFGDYFGASIAVIPEHANIAKLTADYHGLWAYIVHGMSAPPFWLALGGIATAWYLYRVRTDLPKRIAVAFGPLYALVERKYGFDELYAGILAVGARQVGTGLWIGGDQRAIDGVMVNGSARLVGWFSGVVRLFQSGLIYWYAFMMIFGVCAVYGLVKYRILF